MSAQMIHAPCWVLCLLALQVLVYGEALDLSPFMAQQAMDEGPVTYTLSGVIVHLDQVRPPFPLI